MKSVWCIYIPNEGHWFISGKHANKKDARKAALKMLGLKRLPNGSFISR